LKKTLFILIFLFLTLLNISFVLAQNNALILNNSPYITLNGGTSGTPIKLILNQNNTAGISTLGTANGGIQSEGEYNYVNWVIGAGTGTYTIPFYDPNSTERISFSMTIGAAGTGASKYVLFSTYHTSATLTPYPTYDGSTPIGNLNQEYSSPAVSDEAYMVNRWWIIDARSYSSGYTDFSNRPSNIIFNFGFTTGELHSLGLGSLEAQPYAYNVSESKWDDAIVFNQTLSSSGPPAQVTATAVTNANNLFRAWVLVDKSKPLPIELLSFNAVCEGNIVSLNWTTATEINNDYFTIERSKDAQTWETVTAVPGAGNSNTILYYSAVDIQPYPDYTYYRLKQTDYNGAFTYSNVVIASCGSKTTPFNFISINQSQQGEGFVIQFSAGEGEQYSFTFYDIRGRLLQNKSAKAVEGMNEVHINTQGMSNGIYIITLQNETKLISKKIFICGQF
jgi:hypothetical protein